MLCNISPKQVVDVAIDGILLKCSDGVTLGKESGYVLRSDNGIVLGTKLGIIEGKEAVGETNDEGIELCTSDGTFDGKFVGSMIGIVLSIRDVNNCLM